MIRRVPLALPAALVAGVALGARGMPAWVPVWGVALATTAALWAWRRRAVAAAVLALCLACAAAGCAWGAARAQADAPAPVQRAGAVSGTVVVTGTVARSRSGARVPAQVVRLDGPGAVPRGERVLVDLPQGSAPRVGAVARVSGTAGPAAREGSPAWWRAWLRRQGIAARVSAVRWERVGWRAGPWGARDALRRWAQDNVAAGLAGDRAAMVRGMALGGGDALSEVTATRMRDSGLWHLLAVSGQNVAVIGIGVMGALAAAGMARTRRVVVAGAAMLAYCLACDGGASVLRAGLMGGIGVAADLRGGRRAPWNALLVALAAMLVLDPLAIGDPGLQLSFAAVAGLFAVAPPVGQWLRGYVPGRVADLVGQSAGAGLATAPVLAAAFGSVSVVGLVANLVAVPVAGPVVVVAMAGAIANAAWAPLGVLMAWLAGAGAWVIMAVAALAAAIPGAVQPVPAWGALPLAALAALPPLAWWWLRRVPPAPRGGPPRVGPRGAGALVATTCVAVLAVVIAPRLQGCSHSGVPPGVGLRMLDVGQGAAVVLRNGPRAEVLVDAGPPGDPPPVRPALDRMGARSVGTVVVSHGSADHAGGLRAVLEGLPVGRLVLPQADARAPLVRDAVRVAAERGIPVAWAVQGTQVQSGSWHVEVIGPHDGVPADADPNARCLVVLARTPGLRALLPGDAESPALDGLAIPEVDVLQVPHHGSEDPGLPQVMARAAPAVALVSAGRGNPFGHPRAQALAAARDGGAQVLRTDRGGDIDVRAGQGGIVTARG